MGRKKFGLNIKSSFPNKLNLSACEISSRNGKWVEGYTSLELRGTVQTRDINLKMMRPLKILKTSVWKNSPRKFM